MSVSTNDRSVSARPTAGKRRSRDLRPRLGGADRLRPRLGKHSDPGLELGVVSGLAALSLDALTSVAYGPEAMIVILLTAGAGALHWTVPLTLVIVGILVILVLSYTQVISAHPEGGGSYAVAKENLGRRASLLGAASLVVDYVLTVAVSLAAGAASLGSVFPTLAHHLLPVSLVALAILTTVNMFGIGASARLLIVPAGLFVISVLAVLVVGPFHSEPVAVIGSSMGPIVATKTLGLLLLLKAFANGCTAITGIEAIANSVPAFRRPRVRDAQRTELSLGLLLLVMLVGLAVLIRAHGVVPRANVTILAQLTAGAFGKGAFFYVANLSVALALGLAANTSFGGLPVLMSLLAKDNRLPHIFYLRAERPIYRTGIAVLAFAAAVLLVVVDAQTARLIPLFTIGVFIGFTLSQLGLVRHWADTRPPRWRARAALNGLGATLTTIAVIVALFTKFLAGAWVVALVIPLLMITFARIESYYDKVAAQLQRGQEPPRPRKRKSIVITPISDVDLLTERALSAALSMGGTVIAVSVAGDDAERDKVRRAWDQWGPGVTLEILLDPHRSLIRSVLSYIRSIEGEAASITVLIPEVVPHKRRHELLHNQRGRVLADALRAKTDVAVTTLPFRLRD
jgi:amino acid transporter